MHHSCSLASICTIYNKNIITSFVFNHRRVNKLKYITLLHGPLLKLLLILNEIHLIFLPLFLLLPLGGLHLQSR